MTNAMKPDVAFNPINVGLLGPGAVTVQAHACANPFQQFGRLGISRSLDCHPAGFLTALPSMEAGLDDKLPSNSS